jgi:hypothetical protein
MLGVAEGQRRPALGREDVDRAAAVDAVLVGRPPGPLGQGHDAGHDARRDPALDDDGAAVVPDLDRVPVLDLAVAGVDRIDEQALGEGLFEPVDALEGRVDA